MEGTEQGINRYVITSYSKIIAENNVSHATFVKCPEENPQTAVLFYFEVHIIPN